ncbi:MAG: peptide chain release factor N(5)-glutamine methyltransferase [Pseudomonadota bacterium]
MKLENYQPNSAVKNYLTAGRALLTKTGIETASLDARLLMEFVLSVSSEQLLRQLEQPITERQHQRFVELIKLRSKRKPLAQITQVKEFWGREFKVTEDTLIPRPDSETIVAACQLLYSDPSKNLDILDLGTGSGCLVVTLLAEYVSAKAVAIDISFDSLKVAKENAAKFCVNNRLILINASWMTSLDTKFDLIVTNPPYISEQDRNKLQQEISYEPDQALFAGVEGLDCFKDLAEHVAEFLTDDGYLVCECGDQQAEAMIKIFENHDLKLVQRFNDLSGVVRVVAFSKK